MEATWHRNLNASPDRVSMVGVPIFCSSDSCSLDSCALFDDVSYFQREHVGRIGTQLLRLLEIELRAKDEEDAMDMC